ncbi:MAG: 30S ribosomal protein S1, partial [Proteobacteria bacterium]
STDAGGSFATEFEKYVNTRLATLRPGRVVKGTVVGMDREMVTIDIGFKSDGIVPLSQFQDEEGKFAVTIGEEVDVCIVALESENGQVLLSKEKADQLRVWNRVEEAFKKGEIITGKVIQKVKGGLQVDIGIPAFLPGSQIDVHPHRNLDKFLGQVFEFKVLKITRDKGNIVLSRRAVILSERDELRTQTMKVLAEGVVMEGVVKNVTDYGAFIDLGGIDGLLHITDISWGRVNHPAEKLSVGQKVPVVVLKYDGEKERVSLGMKQLKADPWLTVHERYPVGGKVNGKVVNLTDYGAFVEIEDGVEGLIHVSEMSWTKKVRHPSKVVNEGDSVEAVILGIDSEQRRIALGLKQLMPNPWVELEHKLPVGSRVKGKVRSITDFGIFVGIDDGIDGLVHVSDFSWTKRVRDPKEIQEMFKKGDEVEAVVLGVDPENERLSLGIKQLMDDPWGSISQRYPVGVKLKRKATSLTQFGVFVELEEGIEGLIHNSELGLSKDQSAADIFKPGDMIECEVTNIDQEERRISLSIKTIKKRQEKEDIDKYLMDEPGAPITFGQLIEEKLRKDK